jgi:phosphate starvation-inducible PhoH-like protein
LPTDQPVSRPKANPAVDSVPANAAEPLKTALEFTLEPDNSHRLTRLSGNLDGNLRQIESRLDVQIHNRGNLFVIHGTPERIAVTKTVLEDIYALTQGDENVSAEEVHLALKDAGADDLSEQSKGSSKIQSEEEAIIRTKKCSVKARGKNQQRYVSAVRHHDINFGIGPAGTGKTYLAVACAVEALLNDECERLLLVRPAVEAGEKLGFLPGDLSQKVDPYLRPLYDALYEMLGFDAVGKMLEKQIIEIAPLAYMRGRTLNNSFVILDEAQNTTKEQMKMFLTRIGFGSTAVITGDPSQIDLPRGCASGLQHSIGILNGVEGISFTHFTAKDVVRHPLVQRIVEAYEATEAKIQAIEKRRRAQDERLRSMALANAGINIGTAINDSQDEI